MNGFSLRSRLDAGTNAITHASELARGAGHALLNLAESNPTCAGLAFEPDALSELLRDAGNVGYAPEPFGLVEARRAVARALSHKGFDVPVERILLTASTSEAYGYLFKLLCDPGDSVLVPAPSYPLFDMLAQLEGVQLSPYRLAYDGEWHIDRASLEQAVGPRTRAVICVHPNNPTGSFLKRDELALLASLGLPILSDEVFSDYAFATDSTRAMSALEAAPMALVFRLGGLSKSLALPQLKLAWTAIAGPETLAHEAAHRLEHIADAYLSPGTPVQRALPRLLAEGERVQLAIRARAQTNLHSLRAAFERDSSASVLSVEGGWYAIVRLPEVLDEEGWVLTLIERDQVIVQPGYFYDMGRGAHVVLSLITEPSVFDEGVRRLAARLSALTR